MSTNIKWEYSGHNTDVFYFFGPEGLGGFKQPEFDTEFFKEYFKFTTKYSSVSGCTSNGYIEGGKYPLTSLLPINTYRVDVGRRYSFYKPGEIYAPISSHAGLAWKYKSERKGTEYYPLVIIKDSTIICCKGEEFPEILNRKEKLEYKKFEIEYFDRNFEKKTLVVQYCYTNSHLKKLDLLRFLDWETLGVWTPKEDVELNGGRYDNNILSNLNLSPFRGKFIHINEYGFVDKIYDNLEFEKGEVLTEGYSYEGDNVFARLDLSRKNIYYFKSVSYRSLGYDIEGFRSWREYAPLLGWNLKKEILFQHLQERLDEKALEQSFLLVKQEEEKQKIKDLLAQHPSVKISSKDATEAGYCEEGIKEFIERYHLKEIETCASLLDNPEIGDMINNPSFKKLVEAKLRGL